MYNLTPPKGWVAEPTGCRGLAPVGFTHLRHQSAPRGSMLRARSSRGNARSSARRGTPWGWPAARRATRRARPRPAARPRGSSAARRRRAVGSPPARCGSAGRRRSAPAAVGEIGQRRRGRDGARGPRGPTRSRRRRPGHPAAAAGRRLDGRRRRGRGRPPTGRRGTRTDPRRDGGGLGWRAIASKTSASTRRSSGRSEATSGGISAEISSRNDGEAAPSRPVAVADSVTGARAGKVPDFSATHRGIRRLLGRLLRLRARDQELGLALGARHHRARLARRPRPGAGCIDSSGSSAVRRSAGAWRTPFTRANPTGSAPRDRSSRRNRRAAARPARSRGECRAAPIGGERGDRTSMTTAA